MTPPPTQPPAQPPTAPRIVRLIYALPLVGWSARAISRNVNNVFYALAVFVAVVVAAVMAWGPAALTLAALALVPLIFLFFLIISWPYPSKG